MRTCWPFSFLVLVFFLYHGVNGENPYRFFTWKVTYGDIYPLGVKQQVLYYDMSSWLWSALFFEAL